MNHSSQVFGRDNLLMISPAFLSITKYQLLKEYSTTSILGSLFSFHFISENYSTVPSTVFAENEILAELSAILWRLR